MWGLLTSVDFAVLQIIVLSLFAVVGMTLRQLPGFAFRSPTDYANEMGKLHDIYDPTLGTAVVDTLERLQLFHVFSSTWFSIGLVVLIISIVACTIDRTPRLWRQSADIRVVQPDPFFDPKLPDRAILSGVTADAAAAVFRRHRFVVRREEAGGATYLYGDRNRWTKMATLLTHTGLVLFLLAAAITSRLGDEQGLVVAEGESLTVQPIGTPGLLLVRNLGFEAPGIETGHPTDFTTHLAVYQNGAADRREDDPRQRPADGRRLHVPPERVRAGARRRDPRPAGQAAVDRADRDDRPGGRLPVRRVRGPGPGRRPAAAPPARGGRRGRAARAAVRAGGHEPGRLAGDRRARAARPGQGRYRDVGGDGLLRRARGRSASTRC